LNWGEICSSVALIGKFLCAPLSKGAFKILKRQKIKDNLYSGEIWNAVTYFVLYIVIPVIITYFALRAFYTEVAEEIYCYIPIGMSSLNGIYDAINRWVSREKSFRNAKILIIGFCNGMISVYCFAVILLSLIGNSIDCRCDYILLIYIVTIVIAVKDIAEVFLYHIILKRI